LNGPPGTAFNTILNFENGGGHSHGVGSTDPIAAGTITPQSGTLQGNYPQNLIQTYRAGEVCGTVKDVSTVGPNTFTSFYTISAGGFTPLVAGTGVVLVGSTGAHPDNHYGTSDLNNKTNQLGAAFYTQFSKSIYVNDMSLNSGGLFDINGDFGTPHVTHRDGTHVDMNWSGMTEQEREWFKLKAESIGFVVEIHPNPTHWHLHV
jgi:hypothetical protein